MTDPNINLTQLRSHARSTTDSYGTIHGEVEIDPDTLLALIDTAEAAIALDASERIEGLSPHAARRLRETLIHYTTTP
jgi:hypothetical protein